MKQTSRRSLLLLLLLAGCNRQSAATAEAQAAEQAAKERAAAFERSKTATINYWQKYIEVCKSNYAKYGKSKKSKDIVQLYASMAHDFDQLPKLDVDLELTTVINNYVRDFSELSVVYTRHTNRHENISYGLSKINESFWRGLSGDPFGAFREEMADERADKATLEALRTRLRKNTADLSVVRTTLTAKYGTEFPLPE
jgi:hypothetical protein